MMKKLFLTCGILGLLAVSCDKNSEKHAVTSEVTTVKGENVADAQQDLNQEVIDAQNALNEAQNALDKAKKEGNPTLVDVAQKKVDELQWKLDEIQARAGKKIRGVNGAAENADKVLDNTVKSAEAQTDNIEEAAKEIKKAVK
ncbi:hypothetical protein [Riemerella columbina]|uniref:hypothetical protein n=1 Tax=Riemerella columbina TaxID=103810 RepID=UPI0026700A92|nr:hypothetical protein [Riemerella columbina]WKS94433.1 hypothetical protein NYR17_05675 [Riemerella columbina]